MSSFSDLILPSENRIVIADGELATAEQSLVSHLPITFYIDYENKETTNPPQLTLLINPSNMSVNYSKKINATFTRNSFVVEEWGNLQDVLNFTGKIGAYYVIQPSKDFSGLNNYDKTKSASFRNLLYLFMIYKNNGMVYNSLPAERASPLISYKVSKSGTVPAYAVNYSNKIKNIGKVFLQYDDAVYQGSFDEFSIDEAAENPYNLAYSFKFTVQRTWRIGELK